MSEFEETALQGQLSRMAEQLRRETSQWLTNALRTEVEPKNKYVHLVLAMQCNCMDCRLDCCTFLKQTCNAA